MTPTQCGNPYTRNLRDLGGQEIMDLLDMSCLQLSDGDMKKDDPVLRMEEII